MMMELCLLMGLLAVASNPSPYYAALGLVWGSGAGCLVLIKGGVGFLSLILFLIYLGGMMVVFSYCAALVAEPYPEAWGNHVVLWYLAVYNISLIMLWVMLAEFGEMKVLVWGWGEGLGVNHKEWLGVGDMFCSGGWILFVAGWALLLTLFAVLEMVRGYKHKGALRAV
uniref:NADH-ubiquinone oxidoreductase chain 6 n=1 Tax=Odorrana macrotympana TaxID=2820320 RepID=A0A8E5C2Q0_9NEOB|nr:NADH dehydrogenase subunit 6 [Odorrana macrotympana]